MLRVFFIMSINEPFLYFGGEGAGALGAKIFGIIDRIDLLEFECS
jgi:hypothetical protein